MCLIFLSLALALPLQVAFARQTPDSDPASPDAVIHEINFARENPAAYADLAAESRPLHMIERGRAVDEAVRFLKSTRPLPPLTLSNGLCHAAADHCAEQVDGEIGHAGKDHSSPGDRINRYGTWISSCGENISYGQKTARAIVLTLIIDDGVRSRGHRKNIFNSRFTVAGAAFGTHARYRTICSIDFAGGYAERGDTLVAR
jgi:uncharacterized protein YkwD